MDKKFADRHISPWSMKEKIARLIWSTIEDTLFRFSFRTMNGWRVFLLCSFGAKIDKNCVIRNTAHIEIPWNLRMGEHSCLGEHTIIYNLGLIQIGDRVTISQYSHLCAGTHDYTRADLPLMRLPIIIEDDVWVAADVFVAPGVKIGEGTVVGARSSVFKDLPPWKICVGNPARPIKEREFSS